MKNRFYIAEGLRLGGTIELTGDEFHHAMRVHRSGVGEEVELFDGAGSGFVGRIESISRSSAVVSVMAPADQRDPGLRIDLAMALIQPERFELVLQKGTELGVTRFLPLLTERTEVRSERASRKLDRWEKILLEATKQSGRALLPRVAPPMKFEEAIAADGLRILFDAELGGHPPRQRASAVTLFIGPEGGWTPGELEQARRSGCSFQRLGPRRLRAETAAIAAVTMIQLLLGDLSAGA